MPKIAISYRRTDTDATGRIYDRLIQRYGKDSIFRDIDRIRFGVDFRKAVNEALHDTDILLAIVGPNWRGVADDGSIRIHEANDLVRIEVETALKRDIPVIPVLISNAAMPKLTDLPETLSEFSFRNAATIDSGRNFDTDIERLMRSMDAIIDEQGKLQADEQAAALKEKADKERQRAEEERLRKEADRAEQKRQREQEEREKRERKARELEARRKADEVQQRQDGQQSKAQAFLGEAIREDLWKLVLFPWLPVRTLKQARLLTLVGVTCLAVLAALTLSISIYLLFDLYRWGAVVHFRHLDEFLPILSLFYIGIYDWKIYDWIYDWIPYGGLAALFGCCAFGTFFNLRVAASIGLFTIISLFIIDMISLFPHETLLFILPIRFVVAWLAFSGVKGTFTNFKASSKAIRRDNRLMCISYAHAHNLFPKRECGWCGRRSINFSKVISVGKKLGYNLHFPLDKVCRYRFD